MSASAGAVIHRTVGTPANGGEDGAATSPPNRTAGTPLHRPMPDGEDQKCPRGHDAGYVVRDGVNKCVECDAGMVSGDQSTLGDY